MVWNISTGQVVCLSGDAPSQLLHTCSLAEEEKLEKALDCIATTKTTRVINILLILNSKAATGRTINSIPAETRIASYGGSTAAPRDQHGSCCKHYTFPVGLQALISLMLRDREGKLEGKNQGCQVWPGLSYRKWLGSGGFAFMSPPALLATFSLTLCSPERRQRPPRVGGVPDPVEQDPELAGEEERGAWCTARR